MFYPVPSDVTTAALLKARPTPHRKKEHWHGRRSRMQKKSSVSSNASSRGGHHGLTPELLAKSSGSNVPSRSGSLAGASLTASQAALQFTEATAAASAAAAGSAHLHPVASMAVLSSARSRTSTPHRHSTSALSHRRSSILMSAERKHYSGPTAAAHKAQEEAAAAAAAAAAASALDHTAVADRAVDMLLSVAYDHRAKWRNFNRELYGHVHQEYVYIKGPQDTDGLGGEATGEAPPSDIKSLNSALCCVRVSVTVPGTPRDVYPSLAPLAAQREWYTDLQQAKVLYSIDPATDIIYMVVGAPPHKPREFCLLRTRRVFADGSFVVACRSIFWNMVPEAEGRVRADARVVGWIAQPSEQGGTSPSKATPRGRARTTDSRSDSGSRRTSPTLGAIRVPSGGMPSSPTSSQLAMPGRTQRESTRVTFVAVYDHQAERLVADSILGFSEKLPVTLTNLKRCVTTRGERKEQHTPVSEPALRLPDSRSQVDQPLPPSPRRQLSALGAVLARRKS